MITFKHNAALIC